MMRRIQVSRKYRTGHAPSPLVGVGWGEGKGFSRRATWNCREIPPLPAPPPRWGEGINFWRDRKELVRAIVSSIYNSGH